MQQIKDRLSKQRTNDSTVKRVGSYLVYQDRQIGKGSFGEVLLARHSPVQGRPITEDDLACKVINLVGKA